MKNSVLGIALAILIALQAPIGKAQDVSKGSISGVVRDATGAVVTDANVTLSSPTGEKKTKTNSSGEYLFSNLNPGPDYAVSVERSGFSTAKVGGITVALTQRNTADVTLQVGATAQSVE